MATATAKYGIASNPKSSNPRNIVAIGQFVTPTKVASIPAAAHRDGSKPVSRPKVQPKEDPTASVGTISPPLNPPPRATAVKTIFSKNPRYADSPSTAFSTRLNPAPQ